MTEIYNISAGFLQICENYLGKKKLSSEDIFKRLSYEMGGDGKTITKKQLDDYIDKAEKGSVNVDSGKLKALKKIQNNWDNIAKGKDSITYDDMKGHEALLFATVIGTFTKTDIDDEQQSKIVDEVYDILKSYYKVSDNAELKKEDLVKYLNNIISKSSEEDDDTNSEIVGTLVNMISSFDQEKTVDVEI